MSLAALLASAFLLSEGELPKPVQYERHQVYAQAAEIDDNLERVLLAYKNLILQRGASKKMFEMALGFYDDIIKENKNARYLSEAYYYSGMILAEFIDPKNVKEGIRRIELAYNLGKDSLKAQAALEIGSIIYHHAVANEKGFTFDDAEKYLKRVIQLAPGTTGAGEAERLMQKIKAKSNNL